MGIAGDSLIHADDTEVARNCKVLIDNQATLSNLGAEMGTERLRGKLGEETIRANGADGASAICDDPRKRTKSGMNATECQRQVGISLALTYSLIMESTTRASLSNVIPTITCSSPRPEPARP